MKAFDASDIVTLNETGMLSPTLLTGWCINKPDPVLLSKNQLENERYWKNIGSLSLWLAMFSLVASVAAAFIAENLEVARRVMWVTTFAGALIFVVAIMCWYRSLREYDLRAPGMFGFEYAKLIGNLRVTPLKIASMSYSELRSAADDALTQAGQNLKNAEETEVAYPNGWGAGSGAQSARMAFSELYRRMDAFKLVNAELGWKPYLTHEPMVPAEAAPTSPFETSQRNLERTGAGTAGPARDF